MAKLSATTYKLFYLLIHLTQVDLLGWLKKAEPFSAADGHGQLQDKIKILLRTRTILRFRRIRLSP